MKQKLLKQTFLVLALLGAGITNAWADVTNMTTMTGLLGLEDNTTPAWTYYTKTATIKAGETYVYTFTNYTLGSSATAEYQTWIAEIRENTTNYCLDARGDGGGWKYDTNPTNDALTYNYTGTAWNDGSRSVSDFMAAYNGVTVTLTISSSSDGKTVTIARNATLSDNTDFSGTWTCSGFAGNDKTINLIAEASHQYITSVVYTSASGEVTHYEVKDVDLSKFDTYGTTGGSYNSTTGVATFVLPNGNSTSGRVAKLDLSSYFSGYSGTITNVNMRFTENIPNSGRFVYGIYGDTKESFVNGSPDVNNSISVWGFSNNNRIWHTNTTTYVSDQITFNSDQDITVNIDIINKKFTWIQGTSIKAEDKPYVDNTITMPKYFAAYSWSTATGTLSNMTMEIVYLETTYYTATFTNTASNNTVSATIYTDSERKTEISNGMLVNGTKYYFTATEAGYVDYNGDFTVNDSDPSVSFAMTAKEVYNYSVNAVDNESGIIKANIVSGTCYAGETASFYLPTCVLVDGTLYFTTAEASAKSETVSSNNQVFTYEYTTSTVNNVVFFVEGEDISGASQCIATNNQKLASNGYMGRGSNLSVTTLPAGQYTVYVKYINTNSGAHTVIVKADESNIINNTEVTARPTLNGSITLSESSAITLTAAGSSTSGVDYLYIVKTGEVKSISSAGWATYCSPYALDFSGSISGLTNAYFVTGAKANGTTLTLSQITGTIPANTGILLEGSEGSITIPVVASSDTDVTSNKLVGVTEATEMTANSIYVLLNGDSGVGFYQNANAFTVGANTAYLPADFAAGARLFYSFYDDTTGLKAIENGQLTKDNARVYDLQGRRVNGQLKKGLYIVNGKKVAIK